ncbi:MAG: hypothetical protein ACM3IJ_05910 [Candidatus Levyibacteriota bacterium]
MRNKLSVIFLLISAGFMLAAKTAQGVIYIPPAASTPEVLHKFKQVIYLGRVNSTTIPQVVGVKMASPAYSSVVFEEDTGKLIQSGIVNKPLEEPVRISSAANPTVDIPSLHDNNTDTTYDVASTGTFATTTFFYTTQNSITTTQIKVESALYATPPSAVTVYAYDPATDQRRLVTYSGKLLGGTLLFPQVTTKKLELIFGYLQPLRILSRTTSSSRMVSRARSSLGLAVT